jgi:hypothetical protein
VNIWNVSAKPIIQNQEPKTFWFLVPKLIFSSTFRTFYVSPTSEKSMFSKEQPFIATIS